MRRKKKRLQKKPTNFPQKVSRSETLGPAGLDTGDIKDSIQKQLSLEGSETGEVPEKNSEGIKDLLDDEHREKPRVATDGNYQFGVSL